MAVIVRVPIARSTGCWQLPENASRKEIWTRVNGFCLFLKEREKRPRSGHWGNISFHTRLLIPYALENSLLKIQNRRKKIMFVSYNAEWKYLPVILEVIWMFVSLYAWCVMYTDVRRKFTCVWACSELVILEPNLLRTEPGAGTIIMN